MNTLNGNTTIICSTLKVFVHNWCLEISSNWFLMNAWFSSQIALGLFVRQLRECQQLETVEAFPTLCFIFPSLSELVLNSFASIDHVMARLFVTLLESVEKILRCYHSNGFLWQNVCIVIFISLDFTKRNLTLFCEFFLSNFFWSVRP